MSVEKNKLFNVIKQKLPKNVLFTEEIADILDISYDAAYRRLKGKTSLAFEEALELAKHFKISLNKLYELPCDNSFFINKKKLENNIDALIQFYKELSSYVKLFNIHQKTDIVYSAKDIPFYHVNTDSLYWKFRIYVHINFSQNTASNQKISFQNFKPKFSAIEEAKKFRETFRQVNIIDVWEDTTINSSLYQIFYFYKTKILSKDEALLLCEEIHSMIKDIESSAINNSLDVRGSRKNSFELYYSKILNINYSIFFKNEHKKGILLPYNSFSYIKIEDDRICNEVDTYLKKQLQMAKKVSGDFEMERKVFFTTMYDKIEQLKKEINAKVLLSFI